MSGAKLVGGLTLGAAGLATAAHLAKKPKTKKPKEPAMNKTSQFLKQATAPATSSFPKTAGYLKAMSSSGAWCGEVNYLDDFVGTPLYDRAAALVEKELAIRAQRVQERLSRPRPSYEDSYDLEEQIRLDKDLLHLELHRLQNAQAQPGGGEVEAEFEDDGAPKIAAFLKLAAEAAGEVKYESRVADGDPRKSWPSAALGHVKVVQSTKLAVSAQWIKARTRAGVHGDPSKFTAAVTKAHANTKDLLKSKGLPTSEAFNLGASSAPRRIDRRQVEKRKEQIRGLESAYFSQPKRAG